MLLLKLERLFADRMSLFSESHSDPEEGIQDFLDISVRVGGMTRLLLFLSQYELFSLTKGGHVSRIYSGERPLTALYIKDNFCSCLLTDSGTHPHSLYSLSSETDLVCPVTTLAASFWRFSSVFELWAVQL